MSIRAIETRYKGYKFRSRLEARWAVFFDACGLEWEYEKEGFDFHGHECELVGDPLGRYLPDFWLPALRAWLEVKGELPALHWSYTEPERYIYALVQHTGADSGWVFYGMPDVETPCSCVFKDDLPSRLATIADFTPHWVILSDDQIHAARSARFEFGESGAQK
jgi:hypothetical protein